MLVADPKKNSCSLPHRPGGVTPCYSPRAHPLLPNTIIFPIVIFVNRSMLLLCQPCFHQPCCGMYGPLHHQLRFSGLGPLRHQFCCARLSASATNSMTRGSVLFTNLFARDRPPSTRSFVARGSAPSTINSVLRGSPPPPALLRGARPPPSPTLLRGAWPLPPPTLILGARPLHQLCCAGLGPLHLQL